MAPSVGFIGGGRVTRIILGGWAHAGYWPQRVVVSDPAAAALAALRSRVSGAALIHGDNREPAGQEVVFLALHPPALRVVVGELKERLSAAALLVSLAPKVTIGEISAVLGMPARVARVIPNAPSLVGAGFNPVSFSSETPPTERQGLASLLTPLGVAPEVPEADLEAYALLTGMGPTYLWFQLYELLSLAEGFGLEPRAAVDGLGHMVAGALRTMTDAGLSPEELMDLVPVRPLADDEPAFKAAYRARLKGIFDRIRPAVTA